MFWIPPEKSATACIAFVQKRWEEAAQKYDSVRQQYPLTKGAAEALYWAGVSRYRQTKNHEALGAMGKDFTRKYQDSIWAIKASVWV